MLGLILSNSGSVPRRRFLIYSAIPLKLTFSQEERSWIRGVYSIPLLIIFCIDTFSISIFWNIYLCDWVPSLPGSMFYVISIMTPVPLCLGRICLRCFDISLVFLLRGGRAFFSPHMCYQSVQFLRTFPPSMLLLGWHFSYLY